MHLFVDNMAGIIVADGVYRENVNDYLFFAKYRKKSSQVKEKTMENSIAKKKKKKKKTYLSTEWKGDLMQLFC